MALNKLLEQLKVVLAHFDENRTYLGDGYYRLQDFGAGVYEIEYSIAGFCGTFESQPAIKFQVDFDSQAITFLFYRDMVAHPIKFFKPETEADQAFVAEAFEHLLAKFYQHKG
ncbi:MAG: hypothetical protein LBS41_03290 [Streptococcaceae bacterium]|nr:hypothetical protein [Streptococcaceae bacterium]